MNFVNQLLDKRQKSVELAYKFRRLAEEFNAIAISLETGNLDISITTASTQKANDIRELLVKYNRLKADIKNFVNTKSNTC